MEAFDVAISLGFNCNARYQISRFLSERVINNGPEFYLSDAVNLDEAIKQDYGTFFFDWLVTSSTALVRVIESDFDDVFLRENLKIIHTHDWPAVLDVHTGIEYLHLLPWGRHHEMSQEVLNEIYESEYSKIQYLIDKTRKLISSEKKILFIYFGRLSIFEMYKLTSLLEKRVKNYKLLHIPFYMNQWERIGCYIFRFKFRFNYRCGGNMGYSLSFLKRRIKLTKPMRYEGYPGKNAKWDKILKEYDLGRLIDK